ncbi:hypothetical protein CYMTET_50235 [Cymbomonas tetramitiformis]|uniref:Calcineurin-like phosphoesterase domain-containing protein n=1 Tax=Cymbomonas tetramitiformis TaxID=36881 RepID=A0AAE0BNL9_9CHLO|nr:hypothetical protein CYMTET_50235 [Cymbomonas tetramitiformis]
MSIVEKVSDGRVGREHKTVGHIFASLYLKKDGNLNGDLMGYALNILPWRKCKTCKGKRQYRMYTGVVCLYYVGTCTRCLSGDARLAESGAPVAVSKVSDATLYDGTFKIVQFTDLHFGETSRDDQASQRVMQAVLAAEPDTDLVILSGDMISGDKNKMQNDPNWFQNKWQDIVLPLEHAGVPFACVFGNHDSEASLHNVAIAKLDRESSRLSLTKCTPAPGTNPVHINYHLEILPTKKPQLETMPALNDTFYAPHIRALDGSVARSALTTEHEQAAARIWLLDSGRRGCGGQSRGWGCVPGRTIKWIEQEAADLAHQAQRWSGGFSPTPSLSFVHIPPPEFLQAWRSPSTRGNKWEAIACPSLNSGLVSVLRRANITAVYSGHDHNNDFVGLVQGVRLAYGRKSGYGGYGPRPVTSRGARVILLREGEDASVAPTWIRTENGVKHLQAPTWEIVKMLARQNMCEQS